MYIGKISQTIKTSFDYAFLDEEGGYCEEKINVVVNRLSFRDASSKALQEQFSAVDKDTAKLAEILPSLINDWDVYDDKKQTVKSPITTEFLMECPQPFVMQLSECVVGVIQANPQKPASLEDGSAQTGKRANRAKS